MLGLRTQEGERFNRFWSLVQSAAKKQGCVFFLDSGDGREFSTDDMEGEDLSGFLIPESKADAFNSAFKKGLEAGTEWSDFFRFAVWTKTGDTIEISFTE